MVLAHELGHSLWEDVLPHPADKTEEKAIYEGLSDCFAMAAMNDMQQEWLSDPANSPPHPGYQDLGTYAPFSFWAGSYANEDTAQLTPGYPNLWNPKKSWPLDWPTPGFKFTVWSGDRSTFSDYERDSTLFGAVCRLMVTGGPTVAVENTSVKVPAAVTGGGSLHDALASTVQGVVDRQLGFARLTRLMMFTFLEAQKPPTSFHDLIEILAVNRKMLATNEWFETGSEAASHLCRVRLRARQRERVERRDHSEPARRHGGREPDRRRLQLLAADSRHAVRQGRGLLRGQRDRRAGERDHLPPAADAHHRQASPATPCTGSCSWECA